VIGVRAGHDEHISTYSKDRELFSDVDALLLILKLKRLTVPSSAIAFVRQGETVWIDFLIDECKFQQYAPAK
jgi:hypothetical protein